MSKERRSYVRKPVKAGDLPGHFFLVYGDKTVEFTDVQDVSISGIGLTVDLSVPTGAEVGLIYDSFDMSVQLRGNVVWSVKEGDLSRVGVHFDSSDMNDNVLFFMVIREYLDDSAPQFNFG